MTGQIPTLATRRLRLVALQPGDAAAIQRVFPQWAVVQYLASVVPWPYPPGGAETFIREVALPSMRTGAGWYWSIRLATTRTA